MKVLLQRKLGIVFLAIQILLTIAIVGVGLFVDIIPNKYVIIMVLLLLMFFAYTLASQITEHFYIIGRVISGIVCIVIVFSGFYIIRTYAAISDISSTKTQQINDMSVIVMQDDPATAIMETLDYKYGMVTVDMNNTKTVIDAINMEYNVILNTAEFEDAYSLVDALYSNEVQAIIFNEVYRENILDERSDFNLATKILDNHKVEKTVEFKQEETVKSDITNTPFHLYLSGMDDFSNSDSNLIATVNPETRQILLVSTPRDYYIPLSVSNGVPDKLTHARAYGFDCSIETLELLYDIDLDYYMTVNFNGFKKIVDALGGVRVYSDYTFKADWGPSFKKGYNDVDGKQALAFARQRHNLPGGDRQRGKDQMHLIEAIFEKATSPSILKNYSKLMKSLEDSFDTNMKTKQITKLIKYQLNEMPDWNIVTISADGTDAKEYTYTYKSRRLYVMKPNQDTIEKVKKTMKKVMKGKKISQKEIDKTPSPATPKPSSNSSNKPQE